MLDDGNVVRRCHNCGHSYLENRHAPDGLAEAVEVAVRLVEAEPELPGEAPEGYEELVQKVGITRSAKILVRLTKKCIIERIRAEMPAALRGKEGA